MAQHSNNYVISNQTFPATRTDLNNLFSAIKTGNSGSTAPSSPSAGQLWYDTGSSPNLLKFYTGSAWVQLGADANNDYNLTDITATTLTLSSTLTLGGTAVTATAAELNKLDGVTASPTEINYLDKSSALGVTEASKVVTANASGHVIIPDNKNIYFGTDSDIAFTYDETTDDRLEITGGTVYVGNNLTAKRGYGATHTNTSVTGTATPDMSEYQNFVWTLTGNVTLGNPDDEVVGQSGFFVFKQDGTGSRTLSLGNQYKTAGGNGITLSTANGSVDIVPYIVEASGSILLGAVQLAFA